MSVPILNNPLVNPIVSLIIAPIITGIIAVIVYDFFNFRRFYLNFCGEIKDNYSKIQTERLNREFEEMREKFERKIQDPNHEEWIGLGKKISIWILVQKTDTEPTDYYRYLSSNNLRNLIQHGYYDFIKEQEENLTRFYLVCENISNSTQDLERVFNYSPDTLFPNYSTSSPEEKRNYYAAFVDLMGIHFRQTKPELENWYQNLQPLLSTEPFHILKMYINSVFSWSNS